MHVTVLSVLLEALDHRQEAVEGKREERYTALIERIGIRDASQVPAGQVMAPPKARAQKMTTEDDLEGYLVDFEQLGPCLIGEAQAAYQAMIEEEASQYDLVKQAILRCLNIMGEMHRVRFREYLQTPETRLPSNCATTWCNGFAPSRKQG
ncbi:UNVERIFIED_CONTAM: hypothetical protein FKN15_033302 [Acipenser sinensis]